MDSEPAPQSAAGTLEVSIVMPCLNEAETVGTCVQKAQQFLREHRVTGEVIVADNGSRDGSPEIAAKLGARVVRADVKGYGAALMAGIEAARGTYVVMGDSDDSYDFAAVAPLLEPLRAGSQLVMGCRFPSGGGTIVPGAMPWLHQLVGNPILSRVARLFFRCPVKDLYCGLRAFRREAYLTLNLRVTGMEFAYEMIIKATLHGWRIAEVPITLHKDGRTHPPHLRTWQDGWRTLRFMLLYSPYWLFFVPGCVLFFLGAVCGAVLLVSPVQLFGVGFDTNTLLVCAMVVLMGFKLIVFAVSGKLFAVVEGLLPEDPHLNKLFGSLNLEKGVLIGVLLVMLGLGLLIWSLYYWHGYHFGALSYPKSLRMVIPGVTAITLGFEVIFSSFFLSILGLRRK